MPEALLHAANVNTENRDVDSSLGFTCMGLPILDRTMAEQVVMQHILPLPPKADDEAAWTEQLLNVMKYLDNRATVVLFNMSGLKQV